MRYKTLLPSVFLSCCLTNPAWAETFFIDNATDADSALSSANPGDEIVVLNGIYSSGWRLVIDCNGTAQNPILFRAETPGEVTFSGDIYFNVRGDFLIIRDFQFMDIPGDSGANDRVIELRGADSCAVTQNRFLRCGAHRWKHILLIMEGADDNQVSYNQFGDLVGQGVGILGDGTVNLNNHIHHNHFDGVVNDGEGNGQEPIQLGQSEYTERYYNTLVEFNLIENQDGDGDPEMISVKSRGNTIRYNTFRHAGDAPYDREIVLRHAAETTVEGNFLFGVGIRVFGADHLIKGNYIEGVSSVVNVPNWGIRLPRFNLEGYPATENVLIEGNVVVGAHQAAIAIACQPQVPGEGPPVGDVMVQDNICQGDEGILYQECDANGPVTYSGNIGWGGAILSSGISGGGIVEQNPNLIHDGGFWHSPEDDNPRHPLTAADVGPTWFNPASNVPNGIINPSIIETIYPNPFNPRTTIQFNLPESGTVRGTICDVKGRILTTLVDWALPQGPHRIEFTSGDKNGLELPSGTYFFRLEFNNQVWVEKISLVR